MPCFVPQYTESETIRSIHSVKQTEFLRQEGFLLQRLDGIGRQQMAQQQRRFRIVGEIILERPRVVFIGVAVAATVGAGVVVPQSPALYAKTSCAVSLMGRFLEMDTQRVGEDFRRHAAAPVNAERLVILLRRAGLEI